MDLNSFATYYYDNSTQLSTSHSQAYDLNEANKYIEDNQVPYNLDDLNKTNFGGV